MRSTAVSIGSCGSTPLFGLLGQKSAKNRLKWRHNSGWYDIFDINSWRRQLGRPPETNFGTSEVCCAILCRVKGWKMLIFAQKTAKWRNDDVINRLKITEKKIHSQNSIFSISQGSGCKKLHVKSSFRSKEEREHTQKWEKWDEILLIIYVVDFFIE